MQAVFRVVAAYPRLHVFPLNSPPFLHFRLLLFARFGAIDYPVGGSGAIVNALVRGLEKNGGTLKLGTHVEQVCSRWPCEVSSMCVCSRTLGECRSWQTHPCMCVASERHKYIPGIVPVNGIAVRRNINSLEVYAGVHDHEFDFQYTQEKESG